MLSLTEIVGYSAAFCTTLAFLPQTIKVIRERDTQSLSLSMYIIFTIGVLCWLAYGILRNDWVIISANSITSVLSLTILAIKIKQDVL